MKNYFVNKVYEKLNPVVSRWAVENDKSGKIVSYHNLFRSEENYWLFKVICKNDYHISIQFHTIPVGSFKKVKILNVQVDGPAIICESSYSLSLGARIPITIDTYSNRSWISFSEGQFDIDDDSWINDITEYLDKWVNKDKADVEGLRD